MNKPAYYINGRFLSQPVTGVQRFALDFLLELTKTHSVVILHPKLNSNFPELNNTEFKKIGFFKGYFWEQIELPLYLITKRNPPLISLTNLAPVLYPNNIYTIHDLGFVKNPKWYSKGFYLIYNFLVPLLISKSKKIITVSNFTKNEILRNYPLIREEKINIIYNTVSEMFRNQITVSSKIYKTIDTFLIVGSVNPRKNTDIVIDLFSRSPSIGKLYIVGDQKSLSFSSKKNSSTHNINIEYLGRISDEDLLLRYNRSEYFIYPSLYEGFGIPPLEALCCGCKVILSDIEVHMEIYGKCEGVFFFDPTDPKDLNRAINLAKQTKIDIEHIKSQAKVFLSNLKNHSTFSQF